MICNGENPAPTGNTGENIRAFFSMDINQASPKVRWRRILLVTAIMVPIVTFPMWHRLLFPSFWSETRCVFEDSGGNVRKGQGISCEGIGQ